MFTQWRPIDLVLWSTTGTAAATLQAIGFLGWGIALLSTFLIDHFDLFGLRQTVLAFRGRPYTRKTFQERSLYRLVRHPLMLGFLIAFWATPQMSWGHLLFSVATTGYILLGLYDASTGERLPVTGANAGPVEERWVEFGEVVVR